MSIAEIGIVTQVTRDSRTSPLVAKDVLLDTSISTVTLSRRGPRG